jgi:hypothetical protein
VSRPHPHSVYKKAAFPSLFGSQLASVDPAIEQPPQHVSSPTYPDRDSTLSSFFLSNMSMIPVALVEGDKDYAKQIRAGLFPQFDGMSFPSAPPPPVCLPPTSSSSISHQGTHQKQSSWSAPTLSAPRPA